MRGSRGARAPEYLCRAARCRRGGRPATWGCRSFVFTSELHESLGRAFFPLGVDRRRPRRHREYGLEYGLACASRSHSPSVGADEYVCFGSKRWPSTTADATSTSFRFVVRACSRSILKAAGSSTEWRSIRMPFARSVMARRPKAPSRSWYSVKRRNTMSIELCQSCASASVMVLADQHGRLDCEVVLGVPWVRQLRRRPERDQPGGRERLPRRAFPGSPELDGEGVPQPRPLQPGRGGRALRRLGAAGVVRLGAPRWVPIAALIDLFERRVRTRCAPLAAYLRSVLRSRQPLRACGPGNQH